MKRVLLTGMSGVGKSSVIRELARRGYKAVDTDYGGLSEEVDLPPNEGAGSAPGKDWVWREDRIAALLEAQDAEVLFVSGTASNQRKFYRRFDHIVLLTTPEDLMVQRIQRRTDNPYGSRPGEIDRILGHKRMYEPGLRRIATAVVETTKPLAQVVDDIVRIAER